MTLAEILHWLTGQAGKLAGSAETDAVHAAISDLLGDHTASPQQAPAASPQVTPEAAAPVPDTAAESPADAAISSADAPYPGPPSSPVPEG